MAINTVADLRKSFAADPTKRFDACFGDRGSDVMNLICETFYGTQRNSHGQGCYSSEAGSVVVYGEQSLGMHDKSFWCTLKDNGGEYELQIYDGPGHGTQIVSFEVITPASTATKFVESSPGAEVRYDLLNQRVPDGVSG